MKKFLLFAITLIALSCQTDPDPAQYGDFTKVEHELSGLQPTNRDAPNGFACTLPWQWSQAVNLHTATSSSTATNSYYFSPYRTPFYGSSGYNPITTSTLPTVMNTVLTIRVENVGKTSIKFSIDGGFNWTQINRNGAPAYFTISVPDSQFCQSLTEPQMYVYQTIMFKSINCFPDSNNWGARVNLHSCTNGSVPLYSQTGGMTSGWNWSPPSYPCSYTP